MNDRKEKARSRIGRAVLPPPSHNTQPWFFRMSEAAIELHADRTPALPVNDPADRELAIGCGCALMHLRVAGARDAMGVKAQHLPKSGEPDLLACASASVQSNAFAEDAELAEFIERRPTYRKRFENREASEPVVARLVEAATLEGAHFLPILTEEARRQAAQLVTEGDTAQWANPSWRRELAA